MPSARRGAARQLLPHERSGRGSRELRDPWSTLWRGLAAGALGGALLGAGLQISDVAYRSWDTVLLAVGVGALVALPAALVAVITYQWVEARSVRAAWVAGSLAAAGAVVGTAAVLQMLATVLTLGGATAAFVTALVSAPFVTTRRPRGAGPREQP
jgi:hypothetical protein